MLLLIKYETRDYMIGELNGEDVVTEYFFKEKKNRIYN